MSDFILDVWNDLREKRLAPVAVLLALGLIAVPLLLGRGSAAEQPAAPAPAASNQAAGPTVKAAEVDGDSKLGAFDAKDPFKPGTPPPPKGAGTGSVAEPAGSGAKGATGGGGSKVSGGALEGAAGGGAPSSPSPSAPATKAPRSKLYSYAVDIRFGRTGRERRRRGVKRLTVLPSERQPLLVFLGVTSDRRRALFLADSSASQSGEGTCKPSAAACTFVYLSTDNEKDEHFLTDSRGREYALHLLRIRAVEVKSSRSAGASSAAGRLADDRLTLFPSR